MGRSETDAGDTMATIVTQTAIVTSPVPTPKVNEMNTALENAKKLAEMMEAATPKHCPKFSCSVDQESASSPAYVDLTYVGRTEVLGTFKVQQDGGFDTNWYNTTAGAAAMSVLGY